MLFRLGNILLLVTLVAVWLASKANGTIGGYTKDGLVTYYLAGSLLNSIVFWWSTASIREEIANGELGAKVLSKPISYYWQKFFEEFGWHTVSPIFAVLSIGVVAIFLRAHLVLDLSLQAIILLALSVSLASVLFFNISSCLGLLTFWFTETAGLASFIWAGTFLLGGQGIPISFFPDLAHQIVLFLPFRYVYSFPLEIYTRNQSSGDLIFGFGMQIFWLVAFGLLFRWLWQHGLQKYSAYGG